MKNGGKNKSVAFIILFSVYICVTFDHFILFCFVNLSCSLMWMNPDFCVHTFAVSKGTSLVLVQTCQR